MTKDFLIGLDYGSGETITYKAKFERKAVAMNEYLITDRNTGTKKWVAGHTVTEALIKRENELRADPKEGQWRFSQTPLHESTPASHYSFGSQVDVSLADVFCRGLRIWVVRETVAMPPLTGIGGVTL